MSRLIRAEHTNLPFYGIQKIVSGGQTGVDQAALDAAIELGIAHGGWCPKGRLCEAGRIDAKYHLNELSTADYVARTLKNVQDSDGTLILYVERLTGGTALTNRLARQCGKPVHRVRLNSPIASDRVVSWLVENDIRILNVAGPRASSCPSVHRLARQFLLGLLSRPRDLFNLPENTSQQGSSQHKLQ
jgi:Circularly permutated YpsA SLOG family